MSNLLPPNATPQERALSEAVARVGSVPVIVKEMWNPATCPSALLPWMAWAFSVDNWDTNWNDNQKRATIAASIDVQKHKGTIGAVVTALAALGYGAKVQEWFNMEPVGDPYTFDLLLEADQVGISQEALATILNYINTTKNLRSHLNTVRPSVSTKANLITGAATTTGHDITIGYGAILMLDGTWNLDGTFKLSGSKQF